MILRCIKILLFMCLCACEGANNNPFSESVEQEYVSIAYLRSLYSSGVTLIEENVYIEGYVVSSDALNNFYHTLVVQDESAGIEILIDEDDYYQVYTLYSYVRVSVKGLYLSSSGGNIRLGAYSGYYYVEDIPSEYISNFISQSSCDESFEIGAYSLSEISDRLLSCLVIIPDLVLEQDGYLYDQQKTNRIKLYVSDYADFSITEYGDCGVQGVIGKSDGEYYIRPSRGFDITMK